MKKLLVISFLLFTFEGYTQHAIVQQLASEVNQDSLLTYVKQLTALLPVSTPSGPQLITSRLTGTAGNILTATYIKQKLTSWGIAFDEINFSSTGQNIIAKIPGRRAEKILMVGAHYDAVGTNNPLFHYPGADDNASGTAAVLEAARVCAGKQFPVTLHFAFWDEEEQNLTGSRATAPNYNNNLIGYINHDMIAYDSNNDSSFDIHVRNVANTLLLGDKIFNVVKLYNVPLKPRIINPGETATDHGAFWQNNLTAVAVNEEYADEDDFNPNWHRMTDSITYFNIPYFVNMSRFATTAFLHLAMDTSPLLAVNKQSLVDDMLQVYPNPFKQEFTLILNPQLHNVQVEVVDITGTRVYQDNLTSGSHVIPFNQPNGLYFLTVLQQGQIVGRKKVVKLN
ncbi:MAG: M20/M25/M40 family metallo-hydrolase [Bacteroidetes bacterium]|nr:MAG: M20/M25/M40 family metallo-hydrolase [Bacteroidota bacterium]